MAELVNLKRNIKEMPQKSQNDTAALSYK